MILTEHCSKLCEFNRVVCCDVKLWWFEQAHEQIKVITDVKAIRHEIEEDNIFILTQWNWWYIMMG